jgi:hypothetical protein
MFAHLAMPFQISYIRIFSSSRQHAWRVETSVQAYTGTHVTPLANIRRTTSILSCSSRIMTTSWDTSLKGSG